MKSTSSPLASFADALLDPGGPVPEGILAALEPDIKSRFDVYRNNVFASLIEALKDSFPVIEKLLGEDYFRGLAREFITASPPSSPVLLEYGQGFAGFLENFPPLQEMIWLADVARLEMAWLEAYHAADARPLSSDALAGIASKKLAQTRLILHPSARLICSPWPILSIWQANQEEEEEEQEINLDQGGEDILILRPHAGVELHRLGPGSALFIKSLLHKACLDDARQAAMAQSDEFDLAANLARLITSRAIIRIS